MECRVQHSIVRYMSQNQKRMQGQGLHAMWTILCGGWNTTSMPKGGEVDLQIKNIMRLGHRKSSNIS
ncbi:hypothetical protein J1N35_035493 [Gossypium stocksii]|uniref:Uncharacterized protein n=1 Tax=Gossypium stocksii TaxID=47602 RepID=A0A9D3ZR52_9ROSI|nr:hypothetical protein J1N35_035493 [Gossypium stocksii]